MEKSVLFFVKMALTLSLVFAMGCEKDDPGGTVSVDVLIGVTHVYLGDSGCYFGMSNDDANFVFGCNGEFASLGSKKGLGDITKIPTNGWASRVSVICGNGYVGRFRTNNNTTYSYVRIYVDEFLGGGFIRVKYQYPFAP